MKPWMWAAAASGLAVGLMMLWAWWQDRKLTIEEEYEDWGSGS